MPIKQLFYRFQPISLYVILFLSISYFCVQLILSYITHALTLLMASYHMLCNIFALTGSIINIKHDEYFNRDCTENFQNMCPILKSNIIKNIEIKKKILEDNNCIKNKTITNNTNSIDDDDEKNMKNIKMMNMNEAVIINKNDDEMTLTDNNKSRREIKTHNTFGWARIEILTILIVYITLVSLSFSLLIEALQTLVHIEHQDCMHLPMHILILGIIGLILHSLTFLIIGGYTMPLYNRTSYYKTINTNSDTNTNLSRINIKLEQNIGTKIALELLRDICSTIFFIACAIIVYLAEDKEHTIKFIDPILSLFSCLLVVALNYSYMKEACLILLQTIPGNINMIDFEHILMTKFPHIISYHDLHIWQLSTQKYIATVHIVFDHPSYYMETIEAVCTHFSDYNIVHVTIQPEFHRDKTSSIQTSSKECLMQCHMPECIDKVCCKDSINDLREINIISKHCPKQDIKNQQINIKQNSIKDYTINEHKTKIDNDLSTNNISNATGNVMDNNNIILPLSSTELLLKSGTKPSCVETMITTTTEKVQMSDINNDKSINNAKTDKVNVITIKTIN